MNTNTPTQKSFSGTLVGIFKTIFSNKAILLVLGLLLLWAIINLVIDIVSGLFIFLFVVLAIVAIPVGAAVVITWFKTRR